ncbi:MAG: replication initiator protein [Microviridae sp.]|nr:MAG: replication initiator protein [Microviridae sp.]
MCLYPKLIPNRKYLPNKKNKGIVPQCKDERVKIVAVGCGNCMECRKQRKMQWQVRLTEEQRVNKTGKFVTLSFTDESLIKLENEINKDNKLEGYTLDNATATLAIRRFLERWRKSNKKSVKHWLVTELGQNNTERLHIHGIIFTDNVKEIEKRWQYGNVWIGSYVSEITVNYIVKYISKTDPKHLYYKPLVLCSPGIGNKYTERTKENQYRADKTREHYTTRQGVKIALPKYYRNKIYTDEEKEQLWINLLDKKTRYVDGIKIDVSETDEHYWSLLKTKQRENQVLGYGSDKKDWDRVKYERDLRNLKKLHRIAKEMKNTPDKPGERPKKARKAGQSPANPTKESRKNRDKIEAQNSRIAQENEERRKYQEVIQKQRNSF